MALISALRSFSFLWIEAAGEAGVSRVDQCGFPFTCADKAVDTSKS